MKRINFILGAVAALGVFQTLNLTAEGDQVPGGARDPEWILKTFDDHNSIIKLSPEEEREHSQRINRLYNLAKEQPASGRIINEPAGAQAFVPPSTSFQPQHFGTQAPEEAVGGTSDERLIEAVEALQMEIRQLRHDIARQNQSTIESSTDPSATETTQEPSTRTFEK